MKERKSFIYILISIVFLIVLWSAFFIIPTLMELQGLQDESEQYETKIAYIQTATHKTAELEKSVKDLNSEIQITQKKLINYSSLNQLVEIITKEFSKYSIKIHNITPVMSSFLAMEKDMGTISFNRLPLEMKLEAKFMDFAKLLENSENLSFFIHPDQISMEKNKNTSMTLLIDLKASVYVLKGNLL